MAEELLDLANVGAAFQQVGSTGVAQRVRRDVLPDAGARRGFSDDAHDVIIVKRTAGTRRDKESYLAGFSKQERIDTILTAAMGHEGALPPSLTGLFKIAGADAGYTAFQKLAVLAEGPEAGRLTELLLQLDPEGFNATIARLRPEGWTSLRPLFPVLLKIGGSRAVELAQTFLGNEDPRIRMESYRVLLIADQRPGQAERYIDRGLADESAKVVGFVIAHARLRQGPEVTTLLGAYLARPSRRQEEELSLRGISALSAFHTEQARDILIGLLKNRKITFWVKDVRVTNALEEALTQFGDDKALGAVKEWHRSLARWISLLLVQGKVKK